MGLHRLVVAAVASLALVLLAPAAAAAQPQLTDADRAYLVAANQANQAEIAAGTAAWEASTTEMVRQWGAMLVADHRRLDVDVVATADALGVDLPGAPSAEQQQQLAAVGAQTGDALDAAWTEQQITAHETFLAQTRQQAAEGSDPQVVALAQAAAPIVEAHLAMLRSGDAAPSTVDSGTGGQAGQGAAVLPLVLLGAGVLVGAGALTAPRRRDA